VLLVVDGPDDVMEATWQLLRIGYDRPVGWLAGGMLAYRTSGREIASLAVTTVREIADRTDEIHVLDVRQPAEWSEFHAPGAQFITGAEITDRYDEVPRDREVVVACGSGYRSSVAASLLQREGHPRVVNLLGGMTAWQAAGLPTES
jgi:hydroxyacylglutathione hydrolase